MLRHLFIILVFVAILFVVANEAYTISKKLDTHLANTVTDPNDVFAEAIKWLESHRFTRIPLLRNKKITANDLARKLRFFNTDRRHCNEESLESLEGILRVLHFLDKNGMLYKTLVDAISANYELCSVDYLEIFYATDVNSYLKGELGEYIDEQLDEHCNLMPEQDAMDLMKRLQCLGNVNLFSAKDLAPRVLEILRKYGHISFENNTKSIPAIMKNLKNDFGVGLLRKCDQILDRSAIPLGNFVTEFHIPIKRKESDSRKAVEAILKQCELLKDNVVSLEVELSWLILDKPESPK